MPSSFLAVALALVLADPQADRTLLDPIAAAAEETRQRLAIEGASWTAVHELPGGSAFEVTIERYPAAARFEVRIVRGQQHEKLATVVIRDGVWYVEERDTRGRYRPFEAPFALPSELHYYARSDLKFLTPEMTANNAVLSAQELDERRVELLMQGDPELRGQMELSVAQLEDQAAKFKKLGRELPLDQQRTLAVFRRALADGVPAVVDRQTGILLTSGLSPRRVHNRDFTWKGSAEPDWTIDPSEWPDHTAPPAEGELADLVMIGRHGLWKPGTPIGDPEIVLLNVTTGAFRRLPFALGTAAVGCFSLDRKTAFIPGLDSLGGRMGLYAVDLLAGTTRALGDESLPRGVWFVPALSPDGQTLAAMQMVHADGLKSQLHLLDLETNTSRPLGEPADMRLFGWHPESSAIFVEYRERPEGTDEVRSSIAQIGFDGQVKMIRRAGFACFLPTRVRFLFDQPEAGRQWATCDLLGGDVQPAGDGLAEFSFPAPSRDGRLVMLRFVDDQASRPYLVDVNTFETTPIQVGPGLWATPAWQ